MGNLASHVRKSRVRRRTSRHQTNEDSETIAANIIQLRTKLMSIIEIECGLLHTLRSMKLLNQQQIEVIESKPTRSSKISQLIDDVIAMSPEHQEQFLTALNETQQSHVVEYIRANGIRTEAHGDNWPLIVSECHDNIENNWAKLIKMLDPKNGLLDELLSVGCINSQHKQCTEAGKRDAHVNELLLLVLLRRSVSDYNKFVNCLMKMKSYAIVSLLEPNMAGNIHFLRADQHNKLLAKHALLVAKIDTRNGLLAELLAAECITWRQKQFIEEAAAEAESNTRLLDIIKRGSVSDFDTFIECLDKTGQHHVSSLLMEDGVVVQIVAEIASNKNSKRDETRIVEQFRRLLDDNSDEYVEQLRTQMNKQFDERLGRDVRLAALDTQGSIRLFYLCKSLAGAYYLHELYSSDELRTHIEELFTLLLDNDRPVSLDRLVLNMSEYTRGVRHLCVSSNLTLFEEIYAMINDSYSNATLPFHTLLGLNLLPSEMVEILLLKATAQLFVIIIKMTPRAAALTVATLSAVSFIWWRTLTYRQFNKRMLKHYFRQVCYPYKCSPHQLPSIESDGNVCGVAELNNKLYVACGGSNTIQVFTSRMPFSRLEDIKVEGLEAPRDIIVCSETSQLYIADSQQCAIWRVNLLSYKQVDKFITTQLEPWSLSIKSRRLLITPFDRDALLSYGDDGVHAIQLNRIPLPRYMAARHAVESSRNTYIVSHRKRFLVDTQSEYKDGVSEVDVDGRIIRQFNNQLDASFQFNVPNYLLIDASNHVIVADWRNERIVLLKPDLQLKRVLIPKLQGRPTRMCFNEETGLLFVNCLFSTEIRIYKVIMPTTTQ